ncbi:heavy metal-associated isoprenylated plant protein 44 isoform X3 [Magnolia sinica]|uniref:heavy metal-associated isoprenylated plant protein 44 isoform X3 n=1 Tax=Magnolia sinica TaxID=86752 RepID=UPI0026588400|nr:heavy metal-associated isoprenylated plant protein 44 isoform X3 [Magnolia sinica]
MTLIFPSHHLYFQPLSYKAVELKVEMLGFHSEKRLRKCLSRIRGVKAVEIELFKKKVVVRGEAEQGRISKALRRSGFRSEPWCNKNEILLATYVGRCYTAF